MSERPNDAPPSELERKERESELDALKLREQILEEEVQALEEEAHSNIAGKIARYFIDSKLTLLIALASLLLGVMALNITPREENPQIVVPAANVMVMKPGATAAEVENLVVKPLEAILKEMPGVEHTYGMAMNDMGVVTVQFFVGQNKEDSLVKLYDRIMHNMDRIPPGVMQPLIKPVDVDDVPIVAIALSAPEATDNLYTDNDLRRVADDVLEELRKVPGTSVSFVTGGQTRRITVELDPERMQSMGVSLFQIDEMLDAADVEIPSGSLVQGNNVASVRVGGWLNNAKEVGNLVVTISDQGRPVYLHDIANITDGPGERALSTRMAFGPAHSGFATLGGQEYPSVSLAVAKLPGTNAVTVAQAVIDRVEAIKGSIIPEDIHTVVTRDDGAKADDAVNTLVEHLAIAIGSVIIVLIIFLGLRESMIVTATVPLILFLTLAVGMMAGQTINRITLFALILSLGLLVDAAIVVIENIHRHYALGREDRALGAIRGTNEIGNPTNVATLAVVLAFLPMFWVTGMMGPYMAPIPFNVSVAMVASLLIAYVVTPWAAKRYMPYSQHGQGHEEEGAGIRAAYRKFVGPLIASTAKRRLFMGGVVALLIAVLAMPAWDGVLFKMLPKDNKNTFNITIDMPEGTPLEQTDRIAREVGAVVAQNRFVTDYETFVGIPGVIDFNGLLRGAGFKKGSNIAEVRVNLVNKHDRATSSIDIVMAMRGPIQAIMDRNPGANIKLVEDPPGPPVRATLLAELYGPDYDELRLMAGDVRGLFLQTDDVVDVDDSLGAQQTEYRIVVDKEKAALSGIVTGQVAKTLATYLGGWDYGTVHIEGEKNPVPIRFQLPQTRRITPDEIENITIQNRTGMQIPLSEIAKIVPVTAQRPIFHKDGHPVVYVMGELAQTSQVYAVLGMYGQVAKQQVNPPSGLDIALDMFGLGNLQTLGQLGGHEVKQLFTADPNDGQYSLRWDGEMRLTLDVFRDLGTAFGVAVVLIYLLLVGYYRSFVIPLVVMGAIPLTMVGVFPGHMITDQYFTATSMIGVIALAGIVVRNSLLLIDFIIDYRNKGYTLEEAVLEAGAVRFRPILLTALAIILGTAVMITDPVFGGLAVALIFGTFASPILTLVVIPLLYYAIEKRRELQAAA